MSLAAAALLTLWVPAAASGQATTQSADSARPANVPPPIELSPEDRRALDEAGAFVQGYHRDPQPERVPELVRTMARVGFLSARGGEVGPAAGFLRTVFQQNGGRLAEWADGWRDLPEAERRTIATILWATDTDEARAALGRLRDPASPELMAHLDALATRRPTPLVEVELTSPDVIDALWGAWYATGEARYVRRIAEALPLLGAIDPANRAVQPTPQQVEQFAVGAAARWSLTSNAIQDERAYEAVRAALQDAPAAARRPIQEILDTAATERRRREQR